MFFHTAFGLRFVGVRVAFSRPTCSERVGALNSETLPMVPWRAVKSPSIADGVGRGERAKRESFPDSEPVEPESNGQIKASHLVSAALFILYMVLAGLFDTKF